MRFKCRYLYRLLGILFFLALVKLFSRRPDSGDKWSRVTPANNLKNEFYDNLLESDKEHLFTKKPKENPFLNIIINRYKAWQRNVKDWHDYDQIARDATRKGVGEHGVAAYLPDDEKNSTLQNNLYRQQGYNALLSEKISMKRAVPDLRHVACKSRLYLADLPTVSVVIPFQNEHLLTLMRSVHSIVDRSPPELLKEIILVDDKSDRAELKKPLDDYIEINFKKDLVKVVRLEKREGLIRTRLAGARIAVGEVLIFFDSHIECGINWLPPLLEPIALDRKTSVCPIVDVIDAQTFSIKIQGGIRGAFDWHLNYKRLPAIPDDNRRPTDPYPDPIMSGGLFAIDRSWFYELGSYDEGLEFWGGEQYELSFKIWLCGGTLVDAPCSHVGHIYKDFNPVSISTEIAFLANNYKRVAEVWMDDYKEFIYAPDYTLRFYKTGDLSKQHRLRANLKCKSFRWFMETIAFDFQHHFKHKDASTLGEGEISSKSSELCMDLLHRNAGWEIGLSECGSKKNHTQSEQYIYFSERNELRSPYRDACLDHYPNDFGKQLLLQECHGYRGNQEFHYDLLTSQFVHRMSGKCIDHNPESRTVFVNVCQTSSPTQQWKIQYVRNDYIKHNFKSDSYS